MWDIFKNNKRVKTTAKTAQPVMMIEALEGRQFLSASVMSHTTPTPAPQAAIVVEAQPKQTKAEAKAAKLLAKHEATAAKAAAKAAKLEAKEAAKVAKAEAKTQAQAAKELAKVEKEAVKTFAEVENATITSNEALFTTQDIFGEWTGTFLSAKTYTAIDFSVDFNIRWQANKNVQTQVFTGTFDLSAMIGNSAAVTSVTMSRNHDVKMLIKTDTAVVSFNGGLSQNGKQIVGRYTINKGTAWEVGSFVLNKQ
jgi:hypothetical protein